MQKESENTYYAIYKLMEELLSSDEEPFKDEFIGKGNLAYLIDAYYGTKELDDIFVDLRKFVKEKNINDACNLICEAIYAKASVADVEDVYHKQYLLLYKMMKNVYETNELTCFWMVGKELFPDWFKNADFIMS